MTRGRFLVFEGGDASGKTTQARRVAERWGARFTREPGGTEVGEILRTMVLQPEHHLAPATEALLIAAARAQHVADVIEPTLGAGVDVVCDRFVASSLMYQGLGSGLGVDAVAAVNRFATGDTVPDLVILVDVPVAVARARLGEHDRFEGEDTSFHERVRRGYLDLAAADPERWVLVDGSADISAVARAVDAALAQRWPESP